MDLTCQPNSLPAELHLQPHVHEFLVSSAGLNVGEVGRGRVKPHSCKYSHKVRVPSYSRTLDYPRGILHTNSTEKEDLNSASVLNDAIHIETHKKNEPHSQSEAAAPWHCWAVVHKKSEPGSGPSGAPWLSMPHFKFSGLHKGIGFTQ